MFKKTDSGRTGVIDVYFSANILFCFSLGVCNPPDPSPYSGGLRLLDPGLPPPKPPAGEGAKTMNTICCF